MNRKLKTVDIHSLLLSRWEDYLGQLRKENQHSILTHPPLSTRNALWFVSLVIVPRKMQILFPRTEVSSAKDPLPIADHM